MSQVLVLNGPNLNLLGQREPDRYGSVTLADVQASLREQAMEQAVSIDFFQSNSEGALVDRIQQAGIDKCDFMLINPGAYTHTSIAIRDAFLGVGIPFIEIHISNIYAREAFRHHSYLSDIASGVIAGLGTKGYELALTAAIATLKTP